MLEDYFPFCKHKELSPVTIHYETGREGIRIIAKTADGVEVKDSEIVAHSNISKRVERFKKELTTRCYEVIVTDF